jgi:uncharacterized protein
MHKQILSSIEHLRHYLPSQGPIQVFVHHNTLHAFESMPFTKAVIHGMKRYGGEPYLSEVKFHEAVNRGRIRRSDIDAALRNDLGEKANETIASTVTLFQVRKAMLNSPFLELPAHELRWYLSEREWIKQFATTVDQKRLPDSDSEHFLMNATAIESLFQTCREIAAKFPYEPVAADNTEPIRHADVLSKAIDLHVDSVVNELLIKYCTLFTDQGIAAVGLPGRDAGFFKSFCELYSER